MNRKLSYSCMSCDKQSYVENTHNSFGLPSYCPKCLKEVILEKHQKTYDQYKDVKAKHIDEGIRIETVYNDACVALGKVNHELKADEVQVKKEAVKQDVKKKEDWK